MTVVCDQRIIKVVIVKHDHDIFEIIKYRIIVIHSQIAQN